MKVLDFINAKVTYDPYGGQYFWINFEKGAQMLAEMRGYGAIQNLKGVDNPDKFQDEIGRWIADAINEKRERELANENTRRIVE